ncbi:MAG: DUF2062 domain-containing protein [Micavibrio sp.]|nr:DUF2062 domain-containing protein [Micavibrio sp.]
MFSRRTPRSRGQKFREALWPTMGMKRLGLYYKHRMGRLPGTPEFIAKGLALGVSISFTPLIGFHMLLGAGLSWCLRGSILAMLFGSVLGGNIWTLPLIWLGTYKLGNLILGSHHHGMHVMNEAIKGDSFTMHTLMEKPMQLLLPMSVGCIPMVIISFSVTYWLTLNIVRKYKAARLERIRARHHPHLDDTAA